MRQTKPVKRIRGISDKDIAAARRLRRDLTEAEQLLWDALRNRQLNGLKFRRQYPMGPYITDFCCPEMRLIIEIDGVVHEDQRDYDDARSRWLQSYGYRILRFGNEDVMNRLVVVLDQIAFIVADLPPLPELGEGARG